MAGYGATGGASYRTPTAAAQSLMHQTDANGNQQAAFRPNSSVEKKTSSAYWPFCCCFSSSTLDADSTERRGNKRAILGPLSPANAQKKCLVLDLDETLVHSSFKPVPNPDFIIPVEIEGIVHHVYVRKRPGVDKFLKRMGALYEIVIYTASLSKYADPLLDKLDIHKVMDWRLFRQHCVFHNGHYIKDLSILGRPLNNCIILDNSPMSYLFQPDHAVAVTSFIDCMSDRELPNMIPFLEKLAGVDNVALYCAVFDPEKPNDWQRKNIFWTYSLIRTSFDKKSFVTGR